MAAALFALSAWPSQQALAQEPAEPDEGEPAPPPDPEQEDPPPEPDEAPDGEPTDAPAVDPPAGSTNGALYAELPQLVLPVVDADTLGLGSTLRLAAGTFNLNGSGQAGTDPGGMDDEVLTWGLTFDARYFGSLERTKLGYSVVATAAESLARAPTDGGSRITNVLALSALPEGRLYPSPGSPLFLHAGADFAVSFQTIMLINTSMDTEDGQAPGNLSLVLGVGAGRVLAIDPVVRLKRLERALQARGTLNGPIPAEVGSDIIRSWYALLNDFGTYRTLAHTMKRLADGGLLTREPDLRSTYEALAILADPFIVGRRTGWDARIGLGVVQTFIGFDEETPGAPDTEPDPDLALLGSAQHERPLGTDRQLSLRGKLFVDLGGTGDAADPMSDPRFRPWSVRGFIDHAQVFYNDNYDPTGALTLSASTGVSGMRVPDNSMSNIKTGIDLALRAAYSRAMNRGSLATAAADVSVRNDGVFSLIISVGITWGVATGYYTPYVAPVGL